MNDEYQHLIALHGHDPLLGGQPLLISLTDEVGWMGLGISLALLFLWGAVEVPFAMLQQRHDQQILGATTEANIVSFSYVQHCLGISLLSAAVVYVAFALIWGTSMQDFAMEMIGCLVFSPFYIISIKKKDLKWLAIGWGLHPLWDVLLHMHENSPGYGFSPTWYVWACIAFDLIVSFYIFYRRKAWKQKTIGSKAR